MTSLFEDVRSHLRAGVTATKLRDDAGTSSSGSLAEFITGGGIGLKMKNGSLRSVPKKIKTTEVEHRCFFSMSSLTGEHDRTRRRSMVDFGERAGHARQNDAAAEWKAAVRRSWSHVNKAALPVPVYAPKFPRTTDAPKTWQALVQRAVDLHNEGALNGFISTGAGWPEVCHVFPRLQDIRDENFEALKREWPSQTRTHTRTHAHTHTRTHAWVCH